MHDNFINIFEAFFQLTSLKLHISSKSTPIFPYPYAHIKTIFCKLINSINISIACLQFLHPKALKNRYKINLLCKNKEII